MEQCHRSCRCRDAAGARSQKDRSPKHQGPPDGLGSHQPKRGLARRTAGPWNGGALSTAGNLVFEGTGYGQFEALRATSGEKLWSAPAESGVIAGPISYSTNGEQYVAILVGWGGVLPLAAGEIGLQRPRMANVPRMLAFKLGGKTVLPPAPEV